MSCTKNFTPAQLAAKEREEKWLFSEEELRDSPSRADGVSAEDEAVYRRKMGWFIQEVGRKLKLTGLAITTAAIFFQRYFAIHSYRRQDRWMVSCACLLLACKVEEYPCRVTSIIDTQHWVRFHLESANRKPGDPPPVYTALDHESEEFKSVRSAVMSCEMSVMHTMAFDFMVTPPHAAAFNAVQDLLKNKYITQDLCMKLCQTAINLSNDSVRTNLCLQYNQEATAKSLVYMAIYTLAPDVRPHCPTSFGSWTSVLDIDEPTLNGFCQELSQILALTRPNEHDEVGIERRNATNHLLKALSRMGRIKIPSRMLNKGSTGHGSPPVGTNGSGKRPLVNKPPPPPGPYPEGNGTAKSGPSKSPPPLRPHPDTLKRPISAENGVGKMAKRPPPPPSCPYPGNNGISKDLELNQANTGINGPNQVENGTSKSIGKRPPPPSYPHPEVNGIAKSGGKRPPPPSYPHPGENDIGIMASKRPPPPSCPYPVDTGSAKKARETPPGSSSDKDDNVEKSSANRINSLRS